MTDDNLYMDAEPTVIGTKLCLSPPLLLSLVDTRSSLVMANVCNSISSKRTGVLAPLQQNRIG